MTDAALPFIPTNPHGMSLRLRLQAAKRAAYRAFYRAVKRHPLAVPHRWYTAVPDLAGREACLFVSYSPDGQISAQARFHARAWAEQGWAVVLILCTDRPDAYQPDEETKFCNGVLVRANEGYDFGGWATAIALLPSVTAAERLVIINDSIYGPTWRFSEMVVRLRASPADLCGAVESMQFRPHLQSFLLCFGGDLLRSRAFRAFWRGVRIGDRKFVIRTCELELARVVRQADFVTDVLYRIEDRDNPTLTRWRELVMLGFPYIKAQLLRDNPYGADLTGWRDLLVGEGYDPLLIDDHLMQFSR